MASSLLPYVGLDEVTDFPVLIKSLAAEFVGTLFLVRNLGEKRCGNASILSWEVQLFK